MRSKRNMNNEVDFIDELEKCKSNDEYEKKHCKDTCKEDKKKCDKKDKKQKCEDAYIKIKVEIPKCCKECKKEHKPKLCIKEKEDC